MGLSRCQTIANERWFLRDCYANDQTLGGDHSAIDVVLMNLVYTLVYSYLVRLSKTGNEAQMDSKDDVSIVSKCREVTDTCLMELKDDDPAPINSRHYVQYPASFRLGEGSRSSSSRMITAHPRRNWLNQAL